MNATPETMPRKRPSQARSRQTVERLLAATARVLREDGYDKASTNRIAREAGLSVGSLYQYFPNKESLVAALVERQGARELAIVADKLAAVQEAPLDDAVRTLVRAVLDAHRVEPELHRVLMEEVPRVGALARLRATDLEARRLIADFLRLRLPDLAVDDVEVAAFVVMHSVEGVIHEAVLYETGLLEGDQLEDQVTAMIMGYLVSTPE